MCGVSLGVQGSDDAEDAAGGAVVGVGVVSDGAVAYAARARSAVGG